MCRTCHDLRAETCPPALAVREPDFDEDLARERALQARLQVRTEERPSLDATTWLVLRSRLHRSRPAPARPRRPGASRRGR